MKKTLFLFVTVCSLFLCFMACRSSKTDIKEEVTIPVQTSSINGLELSENLVELKIPPSTDSILFTEEPLLTNTTQITVLASNITSEAELEISLYLARDMKHCIASTTLSSNKKDGDFTNLIYGEEYKIGVTAKNASESITIAITD